MSMVFEDRKSAYPNRYMLTDENGNSSYVILERADEPVVVGTALNAENLNKLASKTVNVSEPGTNLDDYKEDGVYYFHQTVTPVNTPAGVNGWLVVMKNNVDGCKQIWLRMGTPAPYEGNQNPNSYQTFIRTWASVTGWGDWDSIMTNKLIPNFNYGTSLPTSGNYLGRLFFLKA